MKFQKLDSNKIKVTVTPSELTVWDINPQAIAPDSPQMREFIASLLMQSAQEIGFDFASASILVEARPHGSDFVFVITRVSPDAVAAQKELTRAAIRKKLLNGQYRAKSVGSDTASYFKFDSLSAFAAFLRAEGAAELHDASLYKADGAYFLTINKPQACSARLCALVSEYALQICGAAFGAYLREHGSVIAKQEDFDKLARCYE